MKLTSKAFLSMMIAFVFAIMASSGPAMAAADLSVTLGVAPAAGLDPTGNVTYTAVVTNRGPDVATGVSLVVTLPAGIIPISATPHGPCVFNAAGTSVNCSLGTRASGVSSTVRIVVHPITIGVKTANARVTGTAPDSNPANNTQSVNSTLTEVGISDVQVTVADDPDPLNVGESLIYRATVRNNGDDDAAGVVLTAVLPVGAPFASASSDRGPCSRTALTVTCGLGAFHVGATSLATIKVVAAARGFQYATFGVALSTPDPNIANNCASARTWVNP